MDQMPDPAPAPMHTAPERVEVTVAINPSFLARARALDKDLSRTFNRALESHVARYERRMTDEELAAVVEASKEYHDKHGFMSDEFSDL